MTYNSTVAVGSDNLTPGMVMFESHLIVKK
jgi:hypothetical protein